MSKKYLCSRDEQRCLIIMQKYFISWNTNNYILNYNAISFEDARIPILSSLSETRTKIFYQNHKELIATKTKFEVRPLKKRTADISVIEDDEKCLLYGSISGSKTAVQYDDNKF